MRRGHAVPDAADNGTGGNPGADTCAQTTLDLNPSAAAYLLATAVCFTPGLDVGCGAALVGAYILRARQRVEQFGFKRSLGEKCGWHRGYYRIWPADSRGGEYELPARTGTHLCRPVSNGTISRA
jgi:hypothetical protein